MRAKRSNPGATKTSARFIRAGRPKAGAKLAMKRWASFATSLRHCEEPLRRSNPGLLCDAGLLRCAKKKQMAKALIESSYFHASYAERLDCHGASAPRNDGV